MRQPVRPRALAAAGGGPTTYSGFGSGAPSGLAYGADTAVYTIGTAFKVTSSGLSLTKIRMWLDSSGGAVTNTNVLSGGDLGVRLYAASNGSTGAEGSALATGTISSLAMDAWNEHTLSSPYALTSGTIYYACIYLPAGRYSAKANTFTSDVVVGPITFPADASSQGVSGTVKNGAFTSSNVDGPPNASFNAAWYGIDVEVSE